MSMGSAFTNAMQPRKSEGYQGILDYLSKDRGGSGSGAGMAMADLAKDKYEDQQSKDMFREGRIRTKYGGQIATPEEEAVYLAQRDKERETALQEREWGNKQYLQDQARLDALDKRDYDRGQAKLKRGDERTDADRTYALEDRGMDIKEGTAQRVWGKADMDLGQQRKAIDHQKLMQSFKLRNADGVTSFFAKYAPSDKDGNIVGGLPIFSVNDKGVWEIAFPSGDVETIDTKEKQEWLNKLITGQHPKYEIPTKKEEAETALLQKRAETVGAPKMSDLINDRKNRAELEGYESPLSETAMQPRGSAPPQTGAHPQAADRPPAPGYQKASDGNWYKKGNNGKYLKWTGGGQQSELADSMAHAGEMSGSEYQQSGLAEEARAMQPPQPKQAVTAKPESASPKAAPEETAMKPRGQAKPGNLPADKTATEIQNEQLRKADKGTMLDKLKEPDKEKREARKQARKERQSKELRKKKKQERERKKKEQAKQRKKKKSKGGKNK